MPVPNNRQYTLLSAQVCPESIQKVLKQTPRDQYHGHIEILLTQPASCVNGHEALMQLITPVMSPIDSVVLAAAASAAPRSLSHNPAENAVLLGSDADNGSYELYVVPRDSKGEASPVSKRNT